MRDMNKDIIPFDPRAGFPAGPGMYYECLKCGDVTPSAPSESWRCRCRNLAIDIDYGRFSADDESAIRLFKFLK